MNTVSDEISNGMDFVTSAHEMWNELRDQCSSVNGHRVYQILKEIHDLEQGDRSFVIYYHKFKNLWDEYTALKSVVACKCCCKCGFFKFHEKKEQRKKLLQFLMGLNDSFSVARGLILMMSPLPSISLNCSLIKQDEKQKQGNHLAVSLLGNVNETQAKHTGSSIGLKPFNQGTKSGLKCTYCDRDGHTIEFCYKLVGYPDKKKAKGKQTTT